MVKKQRKGIFIKQLLKIRNKKANEIRMKTKYSLTVLYYNNIVESIWRWIFDKENTVKKTLEFTCGTKKRL